MFFNFFSLKYNFKIKGITADAAISSDSCLFKLFAFLYYTAHKDSKAKNKLKDHAKALATNEDDFNRNWLFVYESLTHSDLEDEWMSMKLAGVSFIKMPASKDAT